MALMDVTYVHRRIFTEEPKKEEPKHPVNCGVGTVYHCIVLSLGLYTRNALRKTLTSLRRPTSHFGNFTWPFLHISATGHPIHFMYVRPLYYTLPLDTVLTAFDRVLRILETYFAREGS